jgi:4'-phosphopantetheinyl transferase
MPLYKTIIVNNHTKVWIWKIEESYQELRKNITLTEHCEAKVAAMKSEIHQHGFLSIRQLLKNAGYEASALYYDALGKPHLKDGNSVSITHSFIFSAIIISNTKVGIDIERERSKIQKIAAKFIDYEWNYLNEPQLTQKLSIIWCIKESLYKIAAVKGLSFKQHCKVIPFDVTNGKTKAWIHFKSEVEKYDIAFLSFEGFTCAYALKS